MSVPKSTKPTIAIPLLSQETDSYCGPAVTQMLLSHLGAKVTQEEIITTAKIRSRIMRLGARPDHLAKAVALLAPQTQFWFKQATKTQDLVDLVKKYKFPVAVNWQGLFYPSEEEQVKKNKSDENGHYSVVIGIDVKKDCILIADPYSEYAKAPREFSLKWFEKRWWDVVHEKDRKTGKKLAIKTHRFAFVITSKKATFPKKLQMKLPEKLDSLQVS